MNKKRSGIAVAVGIVAGLLVIPAYYRVPIFHKNLTAFCFVAMAMGFIAWLIPMWLEPKPKTIEEIEQGEVSKAASSSSLTLLRAFKIWGLALILATGLLSTYESLIHRARLAHRKKAMAAATSVKPKPRAVAEPEAKPYVRPEVKVERKPEPTVVFPPLQLKGMTQNGAKSSALINGHVVMVGERIDDVYLLAVEDGKVTVGLGGQTKVLTMKK